MFAKLNSMGIFGMDAYPVSVETDLSQGLPSFDVVGLPDASVRESRERVRAAMKNCGLDFPVSRITINLAPADIRKEGPIYDLPFLLALLLATGQIDSSLDGCVFVGELSLSGEVRRVNGVLSMALKAKECGFHSVYVPAGNAAEGAIVQGLRVYPVRHLDELLRHLRGEQALEPAVFDPERQSPVCCRAGFFGGSRSARGKAGAGNCRRRRSQRAADRPAGFRQKHARQANAVHPAGNDVRRID